MYLCVYVCICVYICVYIYVYVCIYVYLCSCDIVCAYNFCIINVYILGLHRTWVFQIRPGPVLAGFIIQNPAGAGAGAGLVIFYYSLFIFLFNCMLSLKTNVVTNRQYQLYFK